MIGEERTQSRSPSLPKRTGHVPSLRHARHESARSSRRVEHRNEMPVADRQKRMGGDERVRQRLVARRFGVAVGLILDCDGQFPQPLSSGAARALSEQTVSCQRRTSTPAGDLRRRVETQCFRPDRSWKGEPRSSVNSRRRHVEKLDLVFGRLLPCLINLPVDLQFRDDFISGAVRCKPAHRVAAAGPLPAR